MRETWKDIPGYDSLYQISDTGSVMSLPGPRKKAGILRPSIMKNGYATVRLANKGVKTTRYIHHLVLEVFVGPRPDRMQCRHLDGSRTNNRLSNLAWGTVTENQNDRVAHGTSNRGEQHPGAKLCNLDIWLIRNCKVGQHEMVEFFNIEQSCVSRIRNHKVWQHV